MWDNAHGYPSTTACLRRFNCWISYLSVKQQRQTQKSATAFHLSLAQQFNNNGLCSFFFSVSACLEKGVIQLNVTGGVCCIECFSCRGLPVLSLLTHLLTVLSVKVFCCKFIFGEIFCLSFAVSQTSFTMTNSMSLSTHRSWHSPHTTSPQYVVKVRIFLFSLYCNW